MTLAEELALKHGLKSWDMGDRDGFGGEYIPDWRAVMAINEALERAAQTFEFEWDVMRKTDDMGAGRLEDGWRKAIASCLRALKSPAPGGPDGPA